MRSSARLPRCPLEAVDLADYHQSLETLIEGGRSPRSTLLWLNLWCAHRSTIFLLTYSNMLVFSRRRACGMCGRFALLRGTRRKWVYVFRQVPWWWLRVHSRSQISPDQMSLGTGDDDSKILNATDLNISVQTSWECRGKVRNRYAFATITTLDTSGLLP